MKKALIAMSGGVDSSVAALLTRQRGFDCVGCTMQLYDGPDESTCCSLDDVEDARAVARRLGMPFYAFNCKDDFRRNVMEPFAESYRRGETPNPCIECNRILKFTRLLRRAEELAEKKGVTVAEIALAWVFRSPMNVFPVVSTTNPERLAKNIGAMEIPLTEEERAWLDLEE